MTDPPAAPSPPAAPCPPATRTRWPPWRRPTVCQRTAVRPSEEGSAIVEFLALTFLLLIPLAYLVLAVFELQGAAFAAEGAARDAARIMAASRTEPVGRAAAQLATQIAFADAGLTTPPHLTISCAANPCLTGGATIRASVSTQVALPLIPIGAAEALGASVTVRANALHVVDRYVDR